MFRRRPGIPLRGGMIQGAPVSPMLVKANRLFNNGNFEESARLYEEMAAIGAQRAGPRAPHLFMQAGKAYFQAGQIQQGKEQVKKGISLLVERKRFKDAHQASMKAIEALQKYGQHEEAQELEDWMKGLLEGHPLPEIQSIRPIGMPKRPPLPLSCPKCGAPVDPLEVTWVDQITAACTFCGNMMRGDSI